MNRLTRPTGRWSVVLALVGLVGLTASACSSPHHGKAANRSSATVGAGQSSSSTSSLPGSTESSLPGAEGSAGTSPTTRSAGNGSSSSHPAGAPAVNTGSSPSNANGAPAPAAPGTYTMAQSGQITSAAFSQSEPPQGTLVVDPAQANGVQVDHRYVNQNNQPANTTTQFLPSGPVILSTTEGSGSTGVSCTFNPPIAAPPWPPAAGKTFSSQGNCGSGTTVAVQGKITGSQTATLKDGETFTV